MYVRCADCEGYSRVALDGPWDRLQCPGCGRKLRLDGVLQLGASPRDRFERAFECCRDERIDLASAYSVLMGIMGLPEARSLLVHGPRGSGSRLYDRGFRRAVRNGWLTADAARARGDRLIYASRLVHEHSLSMHDAFRVADNEVSLNRVLRSDTSSREPVAAPPPSERKLSLVLMGGAALVLLLGGAMLAASRQSDPDTEPSPSKSRPPARAATNGLIQAVLKGTEVRTDANGLPTRVVGPTPQAVLETYCRTQPGLPRPVRALRDGKEAVAVFRRDGRLYSLEMVLDERDGRWSLGNGEDPIATQERVN